MVFVRSVAGFVTAERELETAYPAAHVNEHDSDVLPVQMVVDGSSVFAISRGLHGIALHVTLSNAPLIPQFET